MTANDAGLRPAMDNARRPDVEVCFYHPCGFFWAQVLGFPIQRVREMKKRCPQCGCSRNAMCDWERCKSKPIFNEPMWSTQIQPDTIAEAIGRPGKGRVDKSAIPRAQDYDSMVLRIAPNAFKLSDNRTKLFSMRVFDGKLREPQGARREA